MTMGQLTVAQMQKQRCGTHLNMHTGMGEKVHYKNGRDSQWDVGMQSKVGTIQ